MRTGSKGCHVHVLNLTRSRLAIQKIAQLAERSLTLLKCRLFCQFVFVNHPQMRYLNRKFHGRNRSTDVLAFGQPECGFVGPSGWLGEVIVCLDQVGENAERFQIPKQEELIRCLAHGILHLLGERDDRGRLKDRMLKRQEALIRSLRPLPRLMY